MTATNLTDKDAALLQLDAAMPQLPPIDGVVDQFVQIDPANPLIPQSFQNCQSFVPSTPQNDLITEIVQEYLEENRSVWIIEATQNSKNNNFRQNVGTKYAQNLTDSCLAESVKNSFFGKKKYVLENLVEMAVHYYNDFAHSLKKPPVPQVPVSLKNTLKEIASNEMNEIIKRTSDNFYRSLNKKPTKIQKLAKKYISNFCATASANLHSGFHRESINTVIEPEDVLKEDILGAPENETQKIEQNFVEKFGIKNPTADDNLESHFDFEPENEYSKTEPAVPKKAPEIATVFKYQFGISETCELKPKYRPPKLPPMEISSDHKLSESLKKHANFDLSGKIAKAPPLPDTTNLHVSCIKEKQQQNEFEMVKQATEFVLKLHQEKKERQRKILTKTIPKIDTVSSCVQQIKDHQNELEEKRRQKIRQSIDRINKRNHERKVLNMMSDQLVRILQMENQQKLGYPAKNNSYLPTTAQNGIELSESQKFYFAPLEVVVPPKNGTKKFGQTKTKVEMDHDSELQEINKTLVSKINDMQSKLTFLQKKAADDRIRMKHIRPDASLQPGSENMAPARPQSKPVATVSLSQEKIFGQTHNTGCLTTTYRSSYFKENSTADKARPVGHVVARNLNESHHSALRNSSRVAEGAVERESRLESFHVGNSHQARLLSSLLPRQTESIINPWRQSVLH